MVIYPLPDMGDPGEHRAVPTRGPDPLAPADHTHQCVLATLLVREWSPTVTLTTPVTSIELDKYLKSECFSYDRLLIERL